MFRLQTWKNRARQVQGQWFDFDDNRSGSTYISESMIDIVEIPMETWGSAVLTTARSTRAFLGHFINDWQPAEIDDWTGNTYIAETIAGRIELAPANLGFTTIESSNKVSAFGKWLRLRPTTGNNDMAEKPVIFISPGIMADSVKIPTINPGF